MNVRYQTRMSEQGRIAQLNADNYQNILNRLAKKKIKDILKRFSVLDPANLQKAILAKD